MIEIKDLSHVEIDGEHAGKVVDVVMNHHPRLAEIQQALELYDTRIRERVASLQTTIDHLTDTTNIK